MEGDSLSTDTYLKEPAKVTNNLRQDVPACEHEEPGIMLSSEYRYGRSVAGAEKHHGTYGASKYQGGER